MELAEDGLFNDIRPVLIQLVQLIKGEAPTGLDGLLQ
jgi:hypothetical protein